jgi:putative tryptophan/tyrosine transport system substrate-binding protein
VIVATGGVSIRAAKSATSTIPIVFLTGNPAFTASIASLARPGSNLTGVSTLTVELMSKRIQLLSELVPQAGVITYWQTQTTTVPSASFERRRKRRV